MIVLTRERGEVLTVEVPGKEVGSEVLISLLEVGPDWVLFGVTHPPDVPVERAEVSPARVGRMAEVEQGPPWDAPTKG